MSGILSSFVHGNRQPLQQIRNQIQLALPPQESTGSIVPATAGQMSRQISEISSVGQLQAETMGRPGLLGL